MPRLKTPVRKLPLLSVREVEDLNKQIGQDQAYLDQLNGTPKDAEGAAAEAHLAAAEVADVSTDSVEKRIERSKRALRAMDPANQKITGAERQRAEKRYFDLKERLVPRMLTKEQQNFFPSATDALKDQAYQKAVERAQSKDGEFSDDFISMAHEFKRLARLLWPEDPQKCNLEFIRPSGEGSGRHFKK